MRNSRTMCGEQDMMYDGKITRSKASTRAMAMQSLMPYWYRKQTANNDKTHQHSDEPTAHNNLPLCSGHNGTHHPGKRTERGNTPHAMMLVFDCLLRNLRPGNLAFVLLVRWYGLSGTDDGITVALVLCTSKKGSWRFELCVPSLIGWCRGCECWRWR